MVCTGNQCRSPMAEGLFRHQMERRGLPVQVSSAGLLVDGVPATSTAVEVLDRRGIDLSGHRSRVLNAEIVAASDLVLGMAREHVREAAVAVPAAFPRTFTLKELVRRGAEVGPRPESQSIGEWLELVHEGRTPSDVLGSSTEDDVDDPIGEPRAIYERTADEIEALVDQLTHLIWGAGAEQQQPTRPSPQMRLQDL